VRLGKKTKTKKKKTHSTSDLHYIPLSLIVHSADIFHYWDLL